MREAFATGKTTLLLAGGYNIAWGGVVVLFPASLFLWARMEPPRYPQVWQCVGMMVGVFGVGYLIAAKDPARHWPIVLVGLLGKILGPLGFFLEVAQGRLPWRAGWVIVTNDLIWWVPFVLILRDCLRRNSREPSSGPAVFPRALGPAWQELHEDIRELHSGTRPTRASGWFDVERGEGRTARAVAGLLGFPPPGGKILTRLEIRPHGAGETWRRDFQGHPVVSELSLDDGNIVERFPAGRFRLRATSSAGELRIKSESFSLRIGPLSVRLPTRLAPKVEAAVRASGAGRVSVSVRLSVPGAGKVLAYRGEIQKETP